VAGVAGVAIPERLGQRQLFVHAASTQRREHTEAGMRPGHQVRTVRKMQRERHNVSAMGRVLDPAAVGRIGHSRAAFNGRTTGLDSNAGPGRRRRQSCCQCAASQWGAPCVAVAGETRRDEISQIAPAVDTHTRALLAGDHQRPGPAAPPTSRRCSRRTTQKCSRCVDASASCRRRALRVVIVLQKKGVRRGVVRRLAKDRGWRSVPIT
jgi:hypothetical protein